MASIGTRSFPLKKLSLLIIPFLLMLGATASNAIADPTNLGMVGVVSVNGNYLQGHVDNGELHASNPHRNEEETWFLISVDPANHIYALQNWSNGKFLTKGSGGKENDPDGACAKANSVGLGKAQEWKLISGKPWGELNLVAFVSVLDNTVLAGLNGNSSYDCGGEVEAVAGWSGHNPDGAGGSWAGWWRIDSAAEPTGGRSLWTAVGGVVNGIVAKITPADVGAVLSSL